MTKVLVVEDLPALRQHAVNIVRETIYSANVILANDGSQAVELWRQENPDLIIMDISMPGVSGIQAARQIWSENTATKILFWSQFHKEAYVREIGKIVPDDSIHGYILKTESDQKLAYAIESVLLQDNSYVDPVVRGVQRELKTKSELINESETAILLDLAMGLTDRVIAMRQHISVRGVQNRISALSTKIIKDLDAHTKESAGFEVLNTRVRIVMEAFRQGFINADDLNEVEVDLSRWLTRNLKLNLGCS
jgi:DNA-binding NarL/FixJ family response regulator